MNNICFEGQSFSFGQDHNTTPHPPCLWLPLQSLHQKMFQNLEIKRQTLLQMFINNNSANHFFFWIIHVLSV